MSLTVHAARRAIVIIDGAMVYKRGDFGAPVLGYLRKGKKVKVSNKTYGAFYKVKLRQGVIGYISDVDVKVEGGKAIGSSRRKSRASKRSRKRPVIAGRKLGLGFATVNFADRFKLSGSGEEVSRTSQAMLVSFKYTKPMDWFDGAMLSDFSAGMSVATPSLYENFSLEKPTGFIAVGDYSILIPVHSMTSSRSSLYWGAGIGFSYSNVNLTAVVNSTQTSIPVAELRMGGSLTAGYALRLGSSYLFKFEPKFYMEKETYYGLHFYLQKNLN